MFKNYLIHKEKKYFRGQYKTLALAKKWGRVDLARFCEKLKVLHREDLSSHIMIENAGGVCGVLSQKI